MYLPMLRTLLCVELTQHKVPISISVGNRFGTNPELITRQVIGSEALTQLSHVSSPAVLFRKPMKHRVQSYKPLFVHANFQSVSPFHISDSLFRRTMTLRCAPAE